MPIEITELGDFPTNEIDKAILIANDLQDEFSFIRLNSLLAKEIKMLSYRNINTDEFLPKLKIIRDNFKGYHPFLVVFTESELIGDEWSNLFCDRIRESGISITSIFGVEDVILPKGKLLSYLIYYFAKNALCFIATKHRSHQRTDACVFDFMQNRKDLLLSMKSGALCDKCRDDLLNNNYNLSPEQFEAIDILFNESGKLLKKEEKLHKKTIRIFIGSSVEGLPIARKIQSELVYDYLVEIWNQDTVFGLGSSTIEGLEAAVNQYDFAIFVFTPDDELLTRGKNKSVARDNVIFELGLFIGKIGRFKSFIIHPNNDSISLPSDLNGITTASYNPNSENLSASLGPACEKIRNAINKVKNIA